MKKLIQIHHKNMRTCNFLFERQGDETLHSKNYYIDEDIKYNIIRSGSRKMFNQLEYSTALTGTSTETKFTSKTEKVKSEYMSYIQSVFVVFLIPVQCSFLNFANSLPAWLAEPRIQKYVVTFP